MAQAENDRSHKQIGHTSRNRVRMEGKTKTTWIEFWSGKNGSVRAFVEETDRK